MRQRLIIRTAAVGLTLAWAAGGCTTARVEDANVSTGAPEASLAAARDATGSGGQTDLLADVATRTCEQVKTGHIEASTTVAGLPGQAATGSASLSADFDATGPRASLTIDASNLVGALGSAAGGASGKSKGHMDGLIASLKEPVDVVVEGDAAYIHWPVASQLTGTSAPWVKITGPAGMDAINPSGGTDICSFTDVLRGAGAGVAEVGTEQIGGVETTHYTGEVDLTKTLDRIPADKRADVDKALARLGDATRVPVEIWVDGNGIGRRLVVNYDASKLGHGITGTVSVTVELSRIGEPVTITVPPADQVSTFDLGPLFAMFNSMSGTHRPR